MEIKLPKPYLSYSAISLWVKSKDLFRKRYYYNEKLPDTPFTLFGRYVHEKIENNEGLKHIPRYDTAELQVKVDIEGIPIMGYIDSFDEKDKKFIDYKTSIRNPDGTSKWDELAVHKLDQLPFYSMLIKEKYGQVHSEAKLIWMETKWKDKEYSLGTQKLIGEGDELELTGYFEEFTREIEPWEHDRIKKWIVKNAKEISYDYSILVKT